MFGELTFLGSTFIPFLVKITTKLLSPKWQIQTNSTFIVLIYVFFYGMTPFSFYFHGFRLTNNGANLSSFGFRLAQKRLVMWSWALILVVCTPYAVIFLRNLWKVISFTSPKWFGFRVLFTVSIPS